MHLPMKSATYMAHKICSGKFHCALKATADIRLPMNSSKQIPLISTVYIKTHGSVSCGQESRQPHREYIYRKKENSFFTHA